MGAGRVAISTGLVAPPGYLLQQKVKLFPALSAACCISLMLRMLHCIVHALLHACYVQILQAAAPIFAKFGSAFSGFYLPGASKLSMLDIPGLSANGR